MQSQLFLETPPKKETVDQDELDGDDDLFLDEELERTVSGLEKVDLTKLQLLVVLCIRFIVL